MGFNGPWGEIDQVWGEMDQGLGEMIQLIFCNFIKSKAYLSAPLWPQ